MNAANYLSGKGGCQRYLEDREELMKLHLLHTNDLHGHLEHWDVIRTFLIDCQDTYRNLNEPVLTFDIGDAMDAVHPMVEATQGQVMVDIFNEARYDKVTLGNNEGLNFTKETLAALYQAADFDVIIGNLRDGRTQEPLPWAKPYDFIEVDGLQVLVIGLTAPYQTYPLNGYLIQMPDYALGEIFKQTHKEQSADLTILLSHLGIRTDRKLAQQFPELDVILGAHTHHVLVDGEEVNGVMLGAAGRYGEFVGEMTLTYDAPKHNWSIEAKAHSIEQLAERYKLPVQNDRYRAKGEAYLAEKIISTQSPGLYVQELSGQHSFIHFALEAIMQETNLDLAVLNSGLFLSDLPEGHVTAKQIHEALPHPMHLAVIEMQGWQLLELLEEMDSQAEDLLYQMINGLGFRGKIFGELVWSGISYHDVSQNWSVHSRPIETDAIYRFATVDHLWFLPFFPSIDRYGQPELRFPKFLRHVVQEHLNTLYTD